MTNEMTTPNSHGSRLDRLALFYEGVLTAIVRVQCGRQALEGVDEFRTGMKQALKNIGEQATKRGYSGENVEQANFAVVAFLDEVVMSSLDKGNALWARKSLQEEMFDQRSAGELFFKRLEALRASRDSAELAEVLEVYYLCLLLGYEGRYAVGSKAELHLLMDNVRERIERILLRQPAFSVDAGIPDSAPSRISRCTWLRKLQITGAVTAVVAVIAFAGFRWNLNGHLEQLQQVSLLSTSLLRDTR
jgi:type VI secretion system protein ImpK